MRSHSRLPTFPVFYTLARHCSVLKHQSKFSFTTIMPGSSQLPVSLRDTLVARKSSKSGQLLATNLDLSVLPTPQWPPHQPRRVQG
jgi:hypothetical protein